MSTARPPFGKPSLSPEGLRLREIQPTTDPRWDVYVSAHSGGLVYHTSAWLRVLEREYGQRPVCLALESPAGELCGILPLMATRGLPFGLKSDVGRPRLSSLPRTPAAGPLADDSDCLEMLVRGAVERTRSGARLELKPAEPQLDGLLDEVVGYPWRISYDIKLPDRPEQVRFGRSRNHTRIRSGVRQSERQGVVVRRAGSIADVRAWYRLYLQAMRHNVVPARPWRLFEAMWDELHPRGLMRLLLAERDGQLLGGSILLMFGSTVFYAFNGVARGALPLRPNDLLQWQAIIDACSDGYRSYDLGEVPEGDEGLAHFKSKWGSEGRRLRRYSCPAPSSAQPHGEGEPGPLAGLAERGWQAVPLKATAAAGRLVYRYL